MIEKLGQLTLSKFVDLVCGDTGVLLGPHEAGNATKLAVATRGIVLEYRAIADPGGTNSYFKHVEDWIKAKMNVIIFTMCNNLTTLKQYGRAREVLESYGLSVSGWTDSRVDGVVQSRLARSQRELDDLEAENDKVIAERKNVRAQFDAQIAALMAHFKFQIDPATIKATLYANLVALHNREIKAQMAAFRKI